MRVTVTPFPSRSSFSGKLFSDRAYRTSPCSTGVSHLIFPWVYVLAGGGYRPSAQGDGDSDVPAPTLLFLADAWSELQQMRDRRLDLHQVLDFLGARFPVSAPTSSISPSPDWRRSRSARPSCTTHN